MGWSSAAHPFTSPIQIGRGGAQGLLSECEGFAPGREGRRPSELAESLGLGQLGWAAALRVLGFAHDDTRFDMREVSGTEGFACVAPFDTQDSGVPAILRPFNLSTHSALDNFNICLKLGQHNHYKINCARCPISGPLICTTPVALLQHWRF
jgi:hypothetical protein